MKRFRSISVICWIGIVAVAAFSLGCSSKGSDYAGKWECSKGGREFLKIKPNNGAFLVTDETGQSAPASLNDQGTLVMQGVPVTGSLPLPIDSDTGELICSVCSCNRFKRVSTSLRGLAAAGSREIRHTMSAASEEEAQKKTEADMRNVGTAMFSWVTDNVGAGAAGETVWTGRPYPKITTRDLTSILVPQYLAKLPSKDGWGHDYHYFLNVKNPMAQKVMAIISGGADGKVDHSYKVGAFNPTDYNQDIVWADGYFVRYPKKTAKN